MASVQYVKHTSVRLTENKSHDQVDTWLGTFVRAEPGSLRLPDQPSSNWPVGAGVTMTDRPFPTWSLRPQELGAAGQQTIKKSQPRKIIISDANKGHEENKKGKYKKSIRTEVLNAALRLDNSCLSGAVPCTSLTSTPQ